MEKYVIRNYVDDDCYIGSSCQLLSKRMAWHRQAYQQTINRNRPLYQKMNAIGVKNFYIELLEEYPCDNVEQLRRREGEMIRELKPVLNKDIAGRTDKEWSMDNPEKIKEYKKQYGKIHKEQIKDYNKQYRENNIDMIKQQQKLYHQKNKEKRNKQSSEYQPKNKDTINEKRSVQCECECGGHYTLRHKARHCKTIRHQNYLNNNIENVSKEKTNFNQ